MNSQRGGIWQDFTKPEKKKKKKRWYASEIDASWFIINERNIFELENCHRQNIYTWGENLSEEWL